MKKFLENVFIVDFVTLLVLHINLLGDELDGPRGRIYLIKDMLENNKPANEKIVKHIDRCLSCYSCMTTCPSGVNYMHLIDHGRNHILKKLTKDLLARDLLEIFYLNTLSKSFNFRIIVILTKFLKPFRFFFPKKIREMIINFNANKISKKNSS